MAAAGEGAEYYWGKQRDSSMEGIERLYDRGEISREEYNTIIQIRNLTDEEWEQIELKYNNGEISQEEYEVMEEIREMPEDWKSTENLVKGLGYAGLTGLWEGIQWKIGGKLTGWVPTNNTVLNSLFRIGIDTGFNAGDPVYRAGLEALLDGEDFGETFEKQGGWDAVLINSIIGLIGSAGGEAFDAHNSKKLMNRINNLGSIKGLDDSTSRRIKEILDQENRKKTIDFNKMTDAQLNQHVLELLNNRNSQVDDVAKYLFRDQSGNMSDQVKSKIANGIDAINRTGLLDNMDENKANMIRKQIVEDYFSNKIDLNNINEGKLKESVKIYGKMYEKTKVVKESFSELINKGYIEENKLNELINEHIFIKDDDEFEIVYKQLGGSGSPKNVWAFCYNGNVVYLRKSNNITTITHELNHALGRMFFYDKYTGVLFYHRGLNEAMTEKIAIDLTNGPNISRYSFNVNMLNELVDVMEKAGYDNVHLNAYFGDAGDSYRMKEIVDHIAGKAGTFDRIAQLMDIADGDGGPKYTFLDVQMARIELIAIMTELSKKVGIIQ